MQLDACFKLTGFGATKKTLYTLNFAFYCSFRKQFLEKMDFFSKPCIPQILLFIVFLRNNFSQKSLKCSKTVPSDPNWGASGPKCCPLRIAKSLYGPNIGGQPPTTPVTSVPGSTPLEDLWYISRIDKTGVSFHDARYSFHKRMNPKEIFCPSRWEHLILYLFS